MQTINPLLQQDQYAPNLARWDQGESDLVESLLPRFPMRLALLALLALIIVAGVFFVLALQTRQNQAITPTAALLASGPQQTLTATRRPRLSPPPTNTRIVAIPTLNLPTVTPVPPTVTPSPTRGPCLQVAKQGDSLFAMAVRCGHNNFDVVDAILRLNGMKSPNELQIGQEIQIPWPTPQGGVPAPDVPGQTAVAGGGADAEPTLPPGIMWYVVQKGEDAITIVVKFKINMRILRDLNFREVNFDQCDYAFVAGGPTCKVFLYEGQRLRVPAPAPTATVAPTRSGSETPTPTYTPELNQPYSISPDNRLPFESYEVPTLRWGATGTLLPETVYLIIVTDTTTKVSYYAQTRGELSFELPQSWQPKESKIHEYEWRVVVASVSASATPIPSGYSTEVRRFTWKGR
jgi:hypothetical protein